MKRVVVGMHLCPWAAKVLAENTASTPSASKSQTPASISGLSGRGIDTNNGLRIREIAHTSTLANTGSRSGGGTAVERAITTMVHECLREIEALAATIRSNAPAPTVTSGATATATANTTATATYQTTALVLTHPALLDDFEAYLHFVEHVEARMQAKGLNASVQLATFHPKYRFAAGGGGGDDDDAEEKEEEEGGGRGGGGGEADAAPYTNRSPFPMLHLLRVSDVSKAVSDFGDKLQALRSKQAPHKIKGKGKGEDEDEDGEHATDVIWKTNTRTMERHGVQYMRSVLDSICTDAHAHIANSQAK